MFPSERKLLCERPIHKPDFKSIQAIDLLQRQCLSGSATIVSPFVESIVYEFYANMIKGISINPESAMFHKVYITGFKLEFSPKLIEQHLQVSNSSGNQEGIPNEKLESKVNAIYYI